MFSDQRTASVSRPGFIRTGALAATALASSNGRPPLWAQQPSLVDHPMPINLGLASHTFRNFTRAQLIGFMKQLNVSALNAKDTKDHLPMDPRREATALSDHAAAGIKLHAAGTIYFPKTKTMTYALSSSIVSALESGPSSPAPESKLCRELKSL